MLKQILLKYYFALFSIKNKSNNYGDDNPAWRYVFLQVCATSMFINISIAFSLEFFLDLKLRIFHLGSPLFFIIFLIIPSVFIYYLLYNIYKIHKDGRDLPKYNITKATETCAWIFMILMGVLTIFLAHLRNQNI
ncbi:hypothetical protein [Pedobacter glucosidilyticus]|uniref:hypothetical protein n=1 Tax=Pedobacter glucosidilyticus TaxID=1122941 RepID=UPI0026E972D6|nr:hypothetical protein [Pedobacter glucosidilyticus]